MKIFDLNEDWDYLVILDACRYDYFAVLHKRFFEGVLEKRFSRGVDTPSWCRNTFTGYYGDVIYISGNPYINSRFSVRGCDAGKKFFKVVDVWDFGWDDGFGTVPPQTLTQVALSYLEKYREKRLIIHYLQPHAPYISEKFRGVGFPKPKLGKGVILAGVNRSNDSYLYNKLAYAIAQLATKIRVVSHPWLILERLGTPPASPMDAVRRLYGVEGLREAYKENLELVLKYVAVLIGKILKLNPNAEIVITSDHGELLGEDGLFSHGMEHPLIRVVPWFRVQAVREIPVDAYKEITRIVLKKRVAELLIKLNRSANRS